MPGVEIAESMENQKKTQSNGSRSRTPARPPAAGQRYGPAASRGAYHRPAPRTAASAHSLLLAAWAALWISTCDRGPMRGPAAPPGIVARPDRSRSSLPPCPCPALPALVLSHHGPCLARCFFPLTLRLLR